MLWKKKYLTRIKQIVATFIKHDFQDVIIHLGLRDIITHNLKGSDNRSIALISNISLQENNYQHNLEIKNQPGSSAKPQQLKLALQELGPVFVKLGQLLSTRPDLIPEAYLDQLRSLQDKNEAVPLDKVVTIIEAELNGKIADLFLHFEEKPLASASIGQAHVATLPDGREVVVKVQRPNIFPLVQNDLELLAELAQFIIKHDQQSHRFNLPAIVELLARTMINELDYLTEARNTKALQKNMREFPHIVVPDVIKNYSTRHVLTTTRIFGVKTDELKTEKYHQPDLNIICKELAHCYLKQICIDGFLHSDPHPGNLLVIEPPHNSRPGKRKKIAGVKIQGECNLGQVSGKAGMQLSVSDDRQSRLPTIALIDCGMVTILTRSFQEKVTEFLFFLSESNGERVAQMAIDMSEPMADFDDKKFRQWVTELVTQYSHSTIETMDVGQLIFQIIQISSHTGLRVPTELSMIAKTLFNLDISLLRLSEKFNLGHAVRDYAFRIASKRILQEYSFANIYSQAVQTQHLLTDLPKKVDKLIDQLNDEEFELRLHIDRSTDILKAIQKVANRITMGMITAAIIIGSAIIMHIKTDYVLWGYPGLAIIGFLLATGFGAFLIINMLSNDE